MEISVLLIFAGTLFVAAGSPGPSIAALVARVVSKGIGDVLPFLLAMWIGEAIWLSFAIFGLSYVAQSFHAAFVAVKWAGIAYLVYLAWKMWTAPVKLDETSTLPRADSPMKLFLAGIAVTLGNPKIMMFYLALLPTMVDLKSVGLVGWAELTATMAVVLVVIDLAWVLAASQARRLVRSPRAMRIANRLSAGIMGGAAAAIAARS
ncbi:MAG: LysE family translocator [Rhizobiaceae bacterium]|nr:LysE family translocator [Rhizobiaceae bacterium]